MALTNRTLIKERTLPLSHNHNWLNLILKEYLKDKLIIGLVKTLKIAAVWPYNLMYRQFFSRTLVVG